VTVRPQLDERTIAAVAHLRQERTRVFEHDAIVISQDISHDELGLRQVRRTRDIGDHSAGTRHRNRRAQKVSLQGAEGREVSRSATPPGFRSSPKRTNARAGGIHQDAIEQALSPWLELCIAYDNRRRA
jgi:hypothetical protein